MKKLFQYRPWMGLPLWVAFIVFDKWKGWNPVFDLVALFAVMLWASKT